MFHTILSLLFVFHVVSSVQLAASGTVQSSCISPPLALDLDQNWVENAADSEGWYFPLFGKPENGEDDQALDVLTKRKSPPRSATEVDGGFCPRMTWDKNQTSHFYVFGKLWQTFYCKAQQSYSAMLCTRVEHEKAEDKVNIYTTLTDNKSYWFVLRCWEEGEIDWALLTGDKFIDEETQKKVFEHAASLGFDPTSYYTVDYKKC